MALGSRRSAIGLDECGNVAGDDVMQACAEARRRCAESCEQMAAVPA